MPSVRILDRFILGQLIPSFFFGIMSFTVILVAGGLLFKIADLVIQRGISLGVVLRLFFYSLPGIMVMTIPMSCLLAALLGFGSLSANSELVALKATGLSFQRIITPVLAAAAVVSVMALLMNETLVPMSETAAANLLRYEVFQQTPPLFKEHIFLKDEEKGMLKRVIYVASVASKTGDMKDILVQEFEEGRMRRIISANRGKWVNGQWWIEEGQVFDVMETGSVSLLFQFERQKLSLNMNPSQVGRSSTDPSQMNLFELRQTIKSLALQGVDTGKMSMMLHLRLAVPWASVVLALVGATVGSRPQRSSSGMGLGLSVIIVFVYYVILSFCQSLGETNYIPAPVAAWIPNVVFLILGGFLAKRANQLG